MKEIVLFGEYLLRLTPPGNKKIMQAENLEMHWAGSEANIAVSLATFKKSTRYITSLPKNDIAEAGIAQLHRYGVPTTIIEKEKGRQGIYYYESGIGARSGKVTYDREYSSFSLLEENDIDWDEIFNDAEWFHWSGITPALNENLAKICLKALKIAKEKGITISADFNFRSTLWQYGKQSHEIMPELLEYCNVVLADVDAAKLYFNIKPEENNLVESTCSLLKEKLPNTKYIAMTMRYQQNSSNEYVGYLWYDNAIVASSKYKIDNIAERIGAGDAFMAGLIYGLQEKQPLHEVIEFATACGVMKHFVTGDMNIASKEEIELIMQQKGSGRIIR
ncbi:2-dehydro-3-deoxygluconokinase [Flavobacterium cutihirudinis]|uniref:2-dehydro-3-deoxygluconokinase n=1 Tax=Flavobacterium cutihirudinis TaxID=1265740 RepID=A0A3D9FSP6_9FLAO|nr:sugar kinase [Flavobacterium cutihirudinis]RED23653.1 2-dehydro-3-deoxygluconokinase [Flavobacterium cutihirudinis]